MAEAPTTTWTPDDCLRAFGIYPPINYRDQAIKYIDLKPKPFAVQIPFVEYFERIKRHRADRWQRDFGQRLEDAAVNRHLGSVRAMVHAEPQLGKSSMLAQAYAAWLLGHDPLFRFALATYNVTRSITHSKVVIGIMNYPIHKDIFQDRAGWVNEKAAKDKWSTEARRQLNDGQDSFNPVGLQSGLTGSGFDALIVDDPYADQKEAFSETVRKNLQGFWEYTVKPRMGLYANVFGMFHRYHVEDLAGYLLDTGTFDYWRYASIADGDYVHEETGQLFKDPLNRKPGEFITERRGPGYYTENRKNSRVFNSMFQGRPTSEEGEFFQVGKIATISAEEGRKRKEQCVVLVRAWDLAATAEAGDYSVGTLMGMTAEQDVVVFDIVRKQVDAAGRDELQKKTAKKDGFNVVVSIPKDPAAAGRTAVLHIQQNLKEYEVAVRETTGSKSDRARNYAGATNSEKVIFVSDDDLLEEDQWVKTAKRELRNFPLSDHDDIVDSGADGYNECYERVVKGLVCRNYKPQRNLASKQAFAAMFPFKPLNGNGNDDHAPQQLKIPAEFTIYAGLKINSEQSRPTSGVIAARASEMSGIGETIIAFSEYKAYDGDVYKIIQWLQTQLEAYCGNDSYKDRATIWLHPDSEQFEVLIAQKLKTSVAIFDDDAKAGITEMDWHLLPTDADHPFNSGEKAARMYFLVDEHQLSVPLNEQGFIHARQEFATWGFNDKGEPSAVGGVLDCLRMITAKFATYSRPLTQDQKFEQALQAMMPEPLKGKTAMEIAGMETVPGQMAPMLTLQMNETLLKQRRREEKQYIPGEEEEDSMAGGW